MILGGFKGLMSFCVSVVPVFMFINYVKIKIGGMTGDTVGATSELAEISVLFCCLILF